MPLKNVILRRRKLPGLWRLANKASYMHVNYVRSPFLTAKVIANTHSTGLLRIRMNSQQWNGQDKCPTDLRLQFSIY